MAQTPKQRRCGGYTSSASLRSAPSPQGEGFRGIYHTTMKAFSQTGEGVERIARRMRGNAAYSHYLIFRVTGPLIRLISFASFSPKEKPSVKRADRLYPAPNYRSRGSRQRSWMPGLAKPDQGGKQEANGGKLAFIRAVQAFTGPASEQPFNLFKQFLRHKLVSLLLSFTKRK